MSGSAKTTVVIMKSFVQEIPPSLLTSLYFLGRQPSSGSGTSHGSPVRGSGADPNRTSKPENNDRYPGTTKLTSRTTLSHWAT